MAVAPRRRWLFLLVPLCLGCGQGAEPEASSSTLGTVTGTGQSATTTSAGVGSGVGGLTASAAAGGETASATNTGSGGATESAVSGVTNGSSAASSSGTSTGATSTGATAATGSATTSSTGSGVTNTTGTTGTTSSDTTGTSGTVSTSTTGTPLPGGSVFLGDACDMGDSSNAWGPVERNLSNGEALARDGGPLSIADVVYSHGLGMHAPASINYQLGGACTTLSATLGIDDEMRAAGSVVFEVYGDGALLYQSPVIGGADAGTAIEVDVSGVNQLGLVVLDNGGNGSDHADWAELKVECSAGALANCAPTSEPVVAPEGYTLVWSDEFEGEGAPSADNWSYETGFVRNEELQWYQAANARLQAGFLIIEGRREQVPNPNYQAGSSDWKLNRQSAEYTSTSMHSRGKREFQYGIFEMRGRLVAEPGLWPAWWCLGVNGEWPSNGEIDMLEYYGDAIHANTAVGTSTRWVARWDSVARSMSSFGDDDWDAKFHVWRMEWDAENIVLLLDGEVLNTTVLDDMLNPDGQSPFRQAHYMLLNLAIGGQAGGSPAATHFPSRYEVDYVRVFQ